MTEIYRSFGGTNSFSHGMAIPLLYLENVFHGYLMHLLTLWQGYPQPHSSHNCNTTQLLEASQLCACHSMFCLIISLPFLFDIRPSAESTHI